MWVPPETKDPVLLYPPTRKSVGYYGAVRLRDGRFFFRRETGKFNALTRWEFSKELRTLSTRRLRQAAVIADNARYHHARLHRDWRQREVDWFALDFLPPYNLELNPTERAWKLTRRRCVHSRYFPSVVRPTLLYIWRSSSGCGRPRRSRRRRAGFGYDC
jgi:transposase